MAERRLVEPIHIRLPEGATERIDAVLGGGERVPAFARTAVVLVTVFTL